jgi:DNA mismatch repair protein MutL
MARIEKLPASLANQIAAGEVVERPASVVKELIENSVDAGATRIKVELEDGGVALVRVSDDGEGMDPADALLALERHATSKIRCSEDLFSLTTFGFRGEALPSIASVSKLRLVTRLRGSPEAIEIVVEGGRPVQSRSVGAPEGTTLEVRDLFFNVPARRKFLKSTTTEASHVTESVLLSALARHDLSFFLVRDGRVVREWLRVAARSDRASQAFEGERLIACFGERGLLRIEAHLSAPERARAGAAGLHFLVNGRPVRDRTLARAVAQAYGSVLEPGRYPVGVVHLDLPPAQVDVNVHPQKAEVRFADARALFDAVTRELGTVLARTRSASLTSFERSAFAGSAPKVEPFVGGPMSLAEPSGGADPWNLASAVPPSVPLQSEPPPRLFEGRGFYSSLDLLGQVRSTFLVCAGPDGLYVIDQHAAAERVTFDRLRRSFVERAIATQRLLIPDVIELLPREIATLEERASDVAALGVELRLVGRNAVAVHAVPMILARIGTERIVRDMVAELGREATRPFGDAADLVLATMACHGSIRAGDALSREEAAALLSALDGVDFGAHCPHGRPVVTRVGYDELERRVGR